MKNRKVMALWTAGVSAVFSFLLKTQYTFAATISGFDGKGRLPNLIDSYSSYLENNHAATDWVGKAAQNLTNVLNAIANLFFGIAKLIYMMFDTIISGLMKIDILGDYANAIQRVTKALYDSLFSNFGVLIVFIAMLLVFITFVFKSPEQGVKQFLKVVGVVVLAVVWFNKSGYYIRAANNIASSAQDYMSISVGAKNNKVVVDKGSSADKGKNNANKGKFLSTLRESYFEVAVERPYYLINYATLNKDTIKKRSGKDNSVTALLSNSKNPVTAQEEVQKKVNKINTYKTGGGTDNDVIVNYAVQNGYVQNKIGVAAVAAVPAITWGAIYAILALLMVLLQLLVIFIDLLMPVLAIVSFLPRYSNLFLGGLKNMLALIFAQLFFGFIMVCLQFVSTLSDLVIKVNDVGSYLGNSFLFIMIVYLLWRFRNTIKGVLTRPLNSASTVKGEAKTAKRDVEKVGHHVGKTASAPIKAVDSGAMFIKDKAIHFGQSITGVKPSTKSVAGANDLTDSPESKPKGVTRKTLSGMGNLAEEPIKKYQRQVAAEAGNEPENGETTVPDSGEPTESTDLTDDTSVAQPDLTQANQSDLADPVVNDGQVADLGEADGQVGKMNDSVVVNSSTDLNDPAVTSDSSDLNAGQSNSSSTEPLSDSTTENSVTRKDLEDPALSKPDVDYDIETETTVGKEAAVKDVNSPDLQDVSVKRTTPDKVAPEKPTLATPKQPVQQKSVERLKNKVMVDQPRKVDSKPTVVEPSKTLNKVTKVPNSSHIVKQPQIKPQPVKRDPVNAVPPALHNKPKPTAADKLPENELYHYEHYENGDQSGKQAYPVNKLKAKMRGKRK